MTKCQRHTLSFIRWYQSLHGVPPTQSEMASKFRIDPTSVRDRVRTLVRNGYVVRVGAGLRNIQLVEDALPIVPPMTDDVLVAALQRLPAGRFLRVVEDARRARQVAA